MDGFQGLKDGSTGTPTPSHERDPDSGAIACLPVLADEMTRACAPKHCLAKVVRQAHWPSVRVAYVVLSSRSFAHGRRGRGGVKGGREQALVKN